MNDPFTTFSMRLEDQWAVLVRTSRVIKMADVVWLDENDGERDNQEGKSVGKEENTYQV